MSSLNLAELLETVAKLRQEIAAHHVLFDSLVVGLQEIDTQGTILFANSAHHKIHGYEEGELSGRSILEFSPTPQEKKELAAYLDYLVREQPPPTSWTGRDRRKDGSLVDVKFDWNYMRDRDGNITGFISLITDISADNKLRQELEESEKKFHLLMDSLEAMVYVADMDTYEILFVNKYCRDMLGDISGGICWQNFQQGQSGPCAFCTNRYIVDAEGNPGPPYIWDFHNSLTDRWYHIIDRAIKWIDGRIVRLEIATDITERKKAEQELKESEEKYSKLFNNEIDPIVIFDAETRELIDANDAFLKLYGYSNEEAKRLKAADISAEPKKTITTMKKTARNGNMRIKGRLHKKKDGTVITVDIAAAPFILQDRKVIFTRIQDLTDKVASEKQLRELEERFRIAFKTSPDAININKMDGTFVEINDGFTRLTGYRRDDVLGRTSIDLNIWKNLEDRKTLVQELQRSGQMANLEAEFRMKDGSLKTALMSASKITLRGEPHILSISRDITARKTAEREKARLEAQLRQVYKMEAIGTMAGGIAHDFNNILTIILGNTDLAKLIIKEDNPARKYIDKVVEASGRAKEMVRQILAFSRQAKQNLMPIRPHVVFSETLNLMRATVPSTVDIKLDIDKQCRAIKADPTQLHQVLMNLFTNAVHAMDEKGTLTVSLREVKLTADDTKQMNNMKPGSYAMLMVSDTGTGMSPDVQERIFDPFFTTKKIGEGTGMGLAVVHGIVENHGGMIAVESRPGRGTTFRIYFPIAAGTAPASKEPMHRRYRGNEHILFVDDEETLVDLAVEMLQLHGYRVTAKTRSNEAYKAFKANPATFDLVITDQTMPKMTGSELSRALLKIRPDIPIIICTGYSSKISDAIAQKIGVADYFLKPFDTEKLVRSVRKVLDAKKKKRKTDRNN